MTEQDQDQAMNDAESPQKEADKDDNFSAASSSESAANEASSHSDSADKSAESNTEDPASAPSGGAKLSTPEAQQAADEARKAAAAAGLPAPWWTEKLEHDYDGIQEANVDPPNWWKWLLYGTAVTGFIYFFVFEGLGIRPVGVDALELDKAKYAAIQAELIRQSGEITPEQLETLAHDPATRAAGQAVYDANCAVCHKADGSGQIGPNLTDKYWLHGGSAKDILTVIQQGVPDKGMPAWVTQLGVEKTQSVTAYVLGMRNKNLPGKEPQGEIAP